MFDIETNKSVLHKVSLVVDSVRVSLVRVPIVSETKQNKNWGPQSKV